MSAATAIVVVNYGSASLLAHNLVRVQAAAPGADVVVVDNLTTAAERDRVLALARAHGWETVLPDRNLGFGAGVNRGVDHAAAAGATRVLIVNPDAVLPAEAVRSMARRLDDDASALVAPRIVRSDGTVWSIGHQLMLQDGSMRRCPGLVAEPDARPWVSGAVLMTTVEAWQRVGGFDDRYFLYWEDVDLCQRFVAAGGRLVLADDAVAVHDEGGTQQAGGSRARSTTYYYYNIRNRLLYAALHLDAGQRQRWAASTWSAAQEILLRGGRRQFSRPVAPLRAAIRGVRDGRRMMREVVRSGTTTVPAQNWP